MKYKTTGRRQDKTETNLLFEAMKQEGIMSHCVSYSSFSLLFFILKNVETASQVFKKDYQRKRHINILSRIFLSFYPFEGKRQCIF